VGKPPLKEKIMAETTKKTTERIFVDRGYGNEDPNVFISVNGKNYLLPRGQYSDVPVEVAEEYRRSQAAKENFYKKSSEMIEKSK
jgi:hypothetical protein